MTASNNTNTTSDNSDPTRRVQNPDAQQILEYLDTVDGATLEGLAAKAGLPEAQLRDLLDDLQADDLVTVKTGFHCVRVSAVDQPEVATDGGYVTRLIDAIGGDAIDVDISAGEVFDVLSNRRRRGIIRLLAVMYGDADDETYVEVDEVAEMLVRSSMGLRTTTPVPQEKYNQTYVSLCQHHMPLLDEHGLIVYHDRVKKFRATSRAMEMAQLMEFVADRCDQPETSRGVNDS